MVASNSYIRRGLISASTFIALAAAEPAGALAAGAAAEPAPATGTGPEIVIIGDRYTAGIQAERELDQQGVESYGLSTIDELIGELQGELGDDETPLIIVNGERISDINEIGGLPVETIENVKVLPRGSAVRAGGRTGQRLVNITLKKVTRSATLLAAPKAATDGDWHSERGEATLTYIRDSTRAALTFKARHESDLLESEREIEQPVAVPPYAFEGNVVGFPNTAGEIDPLLSTAAGELVTVSPITDIPNPTLADFVPNANEPAVTDIGEFRTLRPRTRNYDLNGSATTKLAPWLTGTIGMRLSHSTRRSLRGLPQALFVLAPTNAFSPFSTNVALTQYGGVPLATRSERDSGDFSLTLNGRFGSWTSLFNARHFRSTDETKTERRAIVGTIPLADDRNPFATDLFALVPIRTDTAEGKSRTNQAKLSFNGPLFALPAGKAMATFDGSFIGNRLRSETDFALVTQKRSYNRKETGLRGAIELPLTSHDGFGGAIGDLTATAEYRRVHYSDAGNANGYDLGLIWEPRPLLRLSVDLEKTTQPAIVQFLANPTIVTSGVRTFDPLTGDSVDVTQITGGNADLEAEKTRLLRFGAILRLVERLRLQLNAEYTDRKEHNFVSFLPEASAAVMLAFPDRFVRDPDGVLTTVDLRPVNFDSHHEKRFRYGLSLNTNLSSGGFKTRRVALVEADPGEEREASEEAPAPKAAPPMSSTRRVPPTRLSLTASHSIVFKDEITIRSGLPVVDLLEGGAIGIGGGHVRHQFDATASVASGGTGVRLNATWRGKSTLNALNAGALDELRFSPLFNLNIRAFADVHRFLPDHDWTRNLRIALNIQNALNDRQEVRDSDGATPLRYQPGYRDPVGRTIEFEIRKVF